MDRAVAKRPRRRYGPKGGAPRWAERAALSARAKDKGDRTRDQRFGRCPLSGPVDLDRMGDDREGFALARASCSPGSSGATRRLQAAPARVHSPGYLSASVNVELLQNVVHVILDRGGTDRQPAGNLLVGQAPLDERDDLLLARRQGVSVDRFDPSGRQRSDAIEKQRRHPRRADKLATDRLSHGIDQILSRPFTRHERRDSRLRT